MSTLQLEIAEGETLQIDYDKLCKIGQDGHRVIPVGVVDHESERLLIIAYATEEAILETIRTGRGVLYSTSRGKLWRKGEESGDWLKVEEVRVNCDQNSVSYRVIPQGMGKGVCHTHDSDGKARCTCYYRRIVEKDGVLCLEMVK